MLDFGYLTANQRVNVQTFNAATATAGSNWQTWIKPRGINFIHMLVLGGGGAGGGGAGASTAAPGGGGGGGSSAQCMMLYPAWALPVAPQVLELH